MDGPESSGFCRNVAYGLSGAIGAWTVSRWQQIRLLALSAIAVTAFAPSQKRESKEESEWVRPQKVLAVPSGCGDHLDRSAPHLEGDLSEGLAALSGCGDHLDRSAPHPGASTLGSSRSARSASPRFGDHLPPLLTSHPGVSTLGSSRSARSASPRRGGHLPGLSEDVPEWHPSSMVWLLFAAFFDSVGLSPRYLSFRLGFDVLLLAATAIGASATLCFGVDRLREGEPLSGAVCCAIGCGALYQAVFTSLDLAKGVALFQKLDPIQQAGVLKHRALHALSAPKVGRAVVIDGMWDAGFFNRMPLAAVEAVYEKYDVLYHTVQSPKELAALLGKSTAVWGEQADLLILVGHANPRGMALGGGYYFLGTPLEVGAIQQAVRPSGQLMLLGCNTATGESSLALWLARRLQGVEVSGVAAYLNPFITTHSFSPGRFDFRAHFPLALKGFTAPWNTTLSFYSA